MRKPTFQGVHDDFNLGFVVLVISAILLASLVLLMINPLAANIFVVVALSAFALGEALYG